VDAAPHGSNARTTVVIVGAGPAGLVLGQLLQREGIPFVLFERHRREDLRAFPKAGTVEYRTVRLLTEEGIAGSILHFDHDNRACEFRTPDERIVFDYAALTGDRPHFVYPQHELVFKLCSALAEGGGDLRFAHSVEGVHDGPAGVSVLVEDPTGDRWTIEADVAVGCDGVRGPVASSLTGAIVAEESPPVRWLAAIATAPPLEPHTIYGAHPRGFAGQMRRTPTLTRYMLEVPASDTLEAWPVDRLREELSIRLGEPARLADVSFVDPSLVDLRMRVLAPMQEGRVFLAGDAAHLITPAGGKGMNLAIQDAVELAHGLIEQFGPRHDGDRLAGYSRTRLPLIWRTQAFSRWMLRLILSGSDDAETETSRRFGLGMREGWIAELGRDLLLARWFAHAYAGVDPEDSSY
jgi:p-hydroxybenzoate 3-monooxygenase